MFKNHQRRLTPPRPTAAPTAVSSAYVQHCTSCGGRHARVERRHHRKLGHGSSRILSACLKHILRAEPSYTAPPKPRPHHTEAPLPRPTAAPTATSSSQSTRLTRHTLPRQALGTLVVALLLGLAAYGPSHTPRVKTCCAVSQWRAPLWLPLPRPLPPCLASTRLALILCPTVAATATPTASMPRIHTVSTHFMYMHLRGQRVLSRHSNCTLWQASPWRERSRAARRRRHVLRVSPLCVSFTRAGIEWRRCLHAVCMARPYGRAQPLGPGVRLSLPCGWKNVCRPTPKRWPLCSACWAASFPGPSRHILRVEEVRRGPG